jgi:hypothetical protein
MQCEAERTPAQHTSLPCGAICGANTTTEQGCPYWTAVTPQATYMHLLVLPRTLSDYMYLSA